MKDLAVMYHYVRSRNGWNGIHPLTPEMFEEQIQLLTENYHIVSPEDLGKKGPKPNCVLTFDDGTKDQYSIAFELLKRKGLPAYFTVMSGPLENRKIPVFHLVHTVLSIYHDEDIWQELNNRYELPNIEKASLNYYHYEKEELRRKIKYILNFFLSEEDSRQFLEERVIAKYGNKQNFIEQFYISKEEFMNLRKAGMTIGVHCVDHRPFIGDAQTFYQKEIEPCANFIRRELGINPKWYTPAFGGGEHYQAMIEQLEPILKLNGYDGGFLTVQGVNDGLAKFWLKRYDCVNILPLRNVRFEQL